MTDPISQISQLETASPLAGRTSGILTNQYGIGPSGFVPAKYMDIEGYRPGMSLREINNLLAENQGFGGGLWNVGVQTGSEMVSGTLETLGAAGAIGEDIGDFSYDLASNVLGNAAKKEDNIKNDMNVLQELGSKLRAATNEAYPLYIGDEGDASNIIEQVATAFPSIGGAIAMSLIPIGEVAVLAKVLQASKVTKALTPAMAAVAETAKITEQALSNTIKTAGVIGLSVEQEARMESTQYFKQKKQELLNTINPLTKSNYTESEASIAADELAQKNKNFNRAFLLLSNTPQYLLLNGALRGLVKKVQPATVKGLKAMEKAVPAAIKQPKSFFNTVAYAKGYKAGVAGFEIVSEGVEEVAQYWNTRELDYYMDVKNGLQPITSSWYRTFDKYVKEADFWTNAIGGMMGGGVMKLAGDYLMNKLNRQPTQDEIEEFVARDQMRVMTYLSKVISDAENRGEDTEFLMKQATIEMGIYAAQYKTDKLTGKFLFEKVAGMSDEDIIKNDFDKKYVDNLPNQKQLFLDTVKEYNENTKYGEFADKITRARMYMKIHNEEKIKLNDKLKDEEKLIKDSKESLSKDLQSLHELVVERAVMTNVLGGYEFEKESLESKDIKSGDRYDFIINKIKEYKKKSIELTENTQKKKESIEKKENVRDILNVPTKKLASIKAKIIFNDENRDYFGAQINKYQDPKYKQEKIKEQPAIKVANRKVKNDVKSMNHIARMTEIGGRLSGDIANMTELNKVYGEAKSTLEYNDKEYKDKIDKAYTDAKDNLTIVQSQVTTPVGTKPVGTTLASAIPAQVVISDQNPVISEEQVVSKMKIIQTSKDDISSGAYKMIESTGVIEDIDVTDEAGKPMKSIKFDYRIASPDFYNTGFPLRVFVQGYTVGKYDPIGKEPFDPEENAEFRVITSLSQLPKNIGRDNIIYGVRAMDAGGEVFSFNIHTFSGAYTKDGKRFPLHGYDANIVKFVSRIKDGKLNFTKIKSEEDILETMRNDLYDGLIRDKKPFIEYQVSEKTPGHLIFRQNIETDEGIMSGFERTLDRLGNGEKLNEGIFFGVVNEGNMTVVSNFPDTYSYNPPNALIKDNNGALLILVPTAVRDIEGRIVLNGSYITNDNLSDDIANVLTEIISTGDIASVRDAIRAAGINSIFINSQRKGLELITIGDIINLYTFEGTRSTNFDINFKGKEIRTTKITKPNGKIEWESMGAIPFSDKDGIRKFLKSEKITYNVRSEYIKNNTIFPLLSIVDNKIVAKQVEYNNFIASVTKTNLDSFFDERIGHTYTVQPVISIRPFNPVTVSNNVTEASKDEDTLNSIFRPDYETYEERMLYSPYPSLSNTRMMDDIVAIGDNAFEYVRKIANASNDPLIKHLFNRASSIFEDNVPKIQVNAYNVRKNASAYVQDGTNTIFIEPRAAWGDNLEYTIAHELVHIITLSSFNNPKTKEQIDFRKEVIKLYNEFKEKDYGFKGIDNVHEFIAYFFGSLDFRNYLNNIKLDNIVTRFINWIKKLFGYKDSDNTIASLLEKYSGNLLDNLKFGQLGLDGKPTGKIYDEIAASLKPDNLEFDQFNDLINYLNYNALKFISDKTKGDIKQYLYDVLVRDRSDILSLPQSDATRSFVANLNKVIGDRINNDTFEKTYTYLKSKLTALPGIKKVKNVDITDEIVNEIEESISDTRDTAYGKESFEIDPKSTATTSIRAFFNIPIFYKGETVKSSFGFSKYYPYGDSFDMILMRVAGSEPMEVESKIKKLAETDPFMAYVYDSLRSLMTPPNARNRNNYYEIINFISKQYIEFTNTHGDRITKSSDYSAKDALGSIWNTNFESLPTGLIKYDSDGNRVMDVIMGEKIANKYFEDKKGKDVISKVNSIINSLSEIGIVMDRNMPYLIAKDPYLFGNRYKHSTDDERVIATSLAFEDIENAANDIFNTFKKNAKVYISIGDTDEGKNEGYSNHNPFLQKQRSIELLTGFESMVNGSRATMMHRNPDGNNHYNFSYHTPLSKRMKDLKDVNVLNSLSKIFPNNDLVKDLISDKNYEFYTQYIEGMSDIKNGKFTGNVYKNASDVERQLDIMKYFYNNGDEYTKITAPVHGDRSYLYTFNYKYTNTLRSNGELDNGAVDKIFHIFQGELNKIMRVRDTHSRVKSGELKRESLSPDYHYKLKPGGLYSYVDADGLKFHMLPEFNGETDLVNKYINDPSANIGLIKEVIRNMIDRESVKLKKYWFTDLAIRDIPDKLKMRYFNMSANMNDNKVIDYMTKDIITNYIIAYGNIYPLLYNDIAQYGGLLKMFKRLSMMTSPAQSVDTNVNQNARVIVVKDPEFPMLGGESVYNAIRDNYARLGFSENKINELTKKLKTHIGLADDKNKNPKPSDSQVIVSLNFYQKILSQVGLHTPEMEEIITKARYGEKQFVNDNDLTNGLGPLKLSYNYDVWDDEVGDYMRKTIKFTAYPITENLAKDFYHMEDIYDIMKRDRIDMIAFNSAFKVGPKNIIELYDKDRNFIPDNFNGNNSFELPMRGLSLAFDNPHNVEETDVTSVSQARKLIFQDLLDPEFNFESNLFGNKYNIIELKQLFEDLHIANLDDSYKKFLTENGIGIEKDINGNDIHKIVNIRIFSEKILKEAQSRGYDLYTIQAFNLTKADLQAGELLDNLVFRVPLYLMPSEQSVMSFILSMFHNSIIRQEHNGQFMVQSSPVLFERKTAPEYGKLTEENRELLKKYGVGQPKNVRVEGGKVIPAEVYLPYNFYNQYFKDLHFDNLRAIKEENIPKSILGTIFRTPYQTLGSGMPVEVKFLPAEMGSISIVPDGFYQFSDSDNDGDKITVYLPNLERKLDEKGEKTDKWIKIEYDGKKTSAENSYETRENAINDIFHHIYTRPEILSKSFTKNNTDKINDIYSEIVSLIGYESPSVPWSIVDQTRLYNTSQDGKGGNGIVALSAVNHSLFQWTNIKIRGNGVMFKDNNNKILGGPSGTVELNKIRDINGELISENIANYWSALLDAQKDFKIEALNVTKETLPVITTLLRAGIDVSHVSYFIVQPAITDLIKEFNKNMDSKSPITRMMISKNIVKKKMINALNNIILINKLPVIGTDELNMINSNSFAAVSLDEMKSAIVNSQKLDLTPQQNVDLIKFEINILKAFNYYGLISNDLSVIANTINTDVNPRKDLLELRRAVINYRKIENDGFRYISGVNALLNNTLTGSIYRKGVMTAYNTITDKKLYPFETPFYKTIMSFVDSRREVMMSQKDQNNILKSAKAFFSSMIESGLHNLNGKSFDEYRKGLFFGKESVSSRMIALKDHKDAINNVLFINTDVIISEDINYPDRLSFIPSRITRGEAGGVIEAALAGLNSKDPVMVDFMKDFVAYNQILNSGNMNYNGYSRGTPVNYLIATGFSEYFNSAAFNTLLNNTEFAEIFLDQYVMNNANLVDNSNNIDGSIYKEDGYLYIPNDKYTNQKYFSRQLTKKVGVATRKIQYIFKYFDSNNKFVRFAPLGRLGTFTTPEYNANVMATGNVFQSMIPWNRINARSVAKSTEAKTINISVKEAVIPIGKSIQPIKEQPTQPVTVKADELLSKMNNIKDEKAKYIIKKCK